MNNKKRRREKTKGDGYALKRLKFSISTGTSHKRRESLSARGRREFDTKRAGTACRSAIAAKKRRWRALEPEVSQRAVRMPAAVVTDLVKIAR
jgi:hypothetical protein